MIWKPDTAIQQYQQSLVQETLNKHSHLRRKLVGVPKANIHQLAEDLANVELISRGYVDEVGKRHLGNRSTILSRHSNFLYYLWGATHLNCEPVLHPDTFNLGVRKLTETVNALRKILRVEESLESRQNDPEILRSVLDDFGIISDAISRIPFDAILDLRASKEAAAFRTKWSGLVDDARMSSVSSGEDISNDVELLYQVVKTELRDEFELAEKIARSKKYLSYGSYITSGLATLLAPEIAIASLAAGAFGVDPLVNAVQKKIPGLEISIFCSTLQSKVSQIGGNT